MSEENTTPSETPKIEVPKLEPVENMKKELFLNYSVLTVAELFNETFLSAIAKLRKVSLPVNQRVLLKDFCLHLDSCYKKYSDEKNLIIEQYGKKNEETGMYTVSINDLSEENRAKFIQEWNDFHNILIETNLKGKFYLPSSEASLSLDESELIERFIKVPGL